MSTQLNNRAENMLASLERTMKLAAEYGNGEFKNGTNFNKIAKNICLTQQRHKKVLHAIDQAKESTTVASFEELYEKSLKSKHLNSQNPKELKEFKTRAKMLFYKPSGSGNHDGSTIGDGEVMFHDFVSNIDPITKKPMVNPVKNKKCGHHYEKESILASIKINSHLRCPVVGCANKDHITAVNLVDDPHFAQILRDIAQEEEEDSD